jgi:hypothetical protein
MYRISAIIVAMLVLSTVSIVPSKAANYQVIPINALPSPNLQNLTAWVFDHVHGKMYSCTVSISTRNSEIKGYKCLRFENLYKIPPSGDLQAATFEQPKIQGYGFFWIIDAKSGELQFCGSYIEGKCVVIDYSTP